MTNTKSERILKDESARNRRKKLKDIIYSRTSRLYNRLRKQRRKN